MEFADWMSQLPESLKHRPLSEIAIPGSHDSATCDISATSADGPDLGYVHRKLERCSWGIGKRFVANWFRTQSLSLTDQLNHGIRYFDLRIAYLTESDDFVFTHGLLSTPLINALTEITDFLNAHPEEVLLLDFNHFYEVEGRHEMLSGILMKYLSNLLYPMSNGVPAIPSLRECIDSNRRILLFYHYQMGSMSFWSGDFIPSPWPNVRNPDTLISILDKNYSDGRPQNSFYVTQALLTPNTSYAIFHLGSSVRNLSAYAKPSFKEWLKTKCIGPQGINICICDFVQDFDFVPSVLSLNKD